MAVTTIGLIINKQPDNIPEFDTDGSLETDSQDEAEDTDAHESVEETDSGKKPRRAKA